MKNRRMGLGPVGVVLMLATTGAQAGLDQMLGDVMKGALGQEGGSAISTAAIAGLSDSELVAGLKEALGNGVEASIKALGKADGFLGNELVRIAVPKSVSMVEAGARKLGQGKYADEFIASMNRAAEQAVPEAAEVLGKAIKEMSVEDAVGIINGPADAATSYFRKTSTDKLIERFRPIVEKATGATGVTAAYKALAGNAGNMMSAIPGMGNLGGLAGLAGGGGEKATDLDGYVTEKTLDGLFTYIAQEEKRIRENPIARTTDLLEKVFGK